MQLLLGKCFAQTHSLSLRYKQIQDFNARSKNQLLLPTVNLSSIQNGVTYYSLRIFNALRSNLLQLQTNKVSFKLALRKYLVANAFYSVDEFLVQSRNTP
jgi:hypothetical protein